MGSGGSIRIAKDEGTLKLQEGHMQSLKYQALSSYQKLMKAQTDRDRAQANVDLAKDVMKSKITEWEIAKKVSEAARKELDVLAASHGYEMHHLGKYKMAVRAGRAEVYGVQGEELSDEGVYCSQKLTQYSMFNAQLQKARKRRLFHRTIPSC